MLHHRQILKMNVLSKRHLWLQRGELIAKGILNLPAKTCAYHSAGQSAPRPFSSVESAILDAAIKHVPTHGFTSVALNFGARDAGYLNISKTIFPRGVFDLIMFHLVNQRLALHGASRPPTIAGRGLETKLGVGARLKQLVLARLSSNKPLIHKWHEVCRQGSSRVT
jgi:ubiquinone biosynthesis protein COQ9